LVMVSCGSSLGRNAVEDLNPVRVQNDFFFCRAKIRWHGDVRTWLCSAGGRPSTKWSRSLRRQQNSLRGMKATGSIVAPSLPGMSTGRSIVTFPGLPQGTHAYSMFREMHREQGTSLEHLILDRRQGCERQDEEVGQPASQIFCWERTLVSTVVVEIQSESESESESESKKEIESFGLGSPH
jgi:hypothetical protein